MGKFEVSINPNVVKTTSTSSMHSPGTSSNDLRRAQTL